MDKGFKRGKIPIDFSDYISPIAVEIVRKQEEGLEKALYTVLEAYNITVDKDELLKALSYDRSQYEAGYKAGYEYGKSNVTHGHWILHFDDLFPEESTIECSVCHELSPADMPHDNFCPNCGSYNGGDEK